MTLFQKHLQDICRTLGLRIEIPFLIEFESGPIIAEALIKDLGAAGGMLIFTSTESLWDNRNEIAATYGYSVLSENDLLDLESWIVIFSDWGWSNPREEAPEWIVLRNG